MHRAVSAMLGDRLDSSEAADDLGRRLYALNQDALRQRYGGAVLTPAYRYRATTATRIQQLKALHCLIYQCAEGDVPETVLFAEMQARAAALEHAIIHELPEYQAAEWDS
jgi:hypothetical protein